MGLSKYSASKVSRDWSASKYDASSVFSSIGLQSNFLNNIDEMMRHLMTEDANTKKDSNEPRLGTRKTTILIVDDEPSVVATAKKYILRSYNDVIVHDASNGYDALEKLDNFRPDLLILDVKLPGLSGKDVIRAVHGGIGARRMKILGMSGYMDSNQEMLMLGADDVLAKPFSPTQLKDKIDNLIPWLSIRPQLEPDSVSLADSTVN